MPSVRWMKVRRSLIKMLRDWEERRKTAFFRHEGGDVARPAAFSEVGGRGLDSEV
jgi:hypothetical protein